jgi:1,4-alpha-glucan branching enzyme
MLTKVLGDRAGTVEVRFELAWPDGATRAAVAGEFNGWSTTANPMWRGDDGVFRAIVVVEMGRRYRFRYVLDGERWINAWDADEYEVNEFGGDDSVVRTDDVSE